MGTTWEGSPPAEYATAVRLSIDDAKDLGGLEDRPDLARRQRGVGGQDLDFMTSITELARLAVGVESMVC